MNDANAGSPNRVLVIDLGGTHVKVMHSGDGEERKADSGPAMTPAAMVAAVRELAGDWSYDAVSLGYPGPVVHGRIAREPVHLGPGWVDFDFVGALGRPVRIINDAAMQALGSYEGGTMLFLGLGTGLGAALVLDGRVQALELGHLPYRKGRTFEDYVGKAGLERLGVVKWRRKVAKVVKILTAAMVSDTVVLGGGNAHKLEGPPPGCRLGDNTNAFTGGFKLWADR